MRVVRSEEGLARLASAATALNCLRPIEELLDEITVAARGIVPSHQAVTSLTTHSALESVTSVSLSEKYAQWREDAASPNGSGVNAVVVASDRSVRMTQLELELHPGRGSFGAEAGRLPPMRGLLAAPLVARDGSSLGMIQLSDRTDGDFSADDEALLALLAELASAAVENARLLASATQLAATLHAVFDSAPSGVVVTDADGLVTRMNQTAAGLLGPLPDPEGGPLAVADLFEGVRDATGVPIPIEQLPTARAQTGETVQDAVLVRSGRGPGGGSLLVSAAPFRGPDGRAGAVTLVDDVSAYWETAETHRLLAGAVEDGLDAVVLYTPIHDADGRIVDLEFRYLNDAASSMYGHDDLVGARHGVVFPGLGAQSLLRGYEDVHRAGVPIEVEVRGETSNHNWFRASLVPLHNGLGIRFRDITEERQEAEDLRAREALLREAEAGSRIGSWSWTLGTREVRWSPELYEIFGLVPGLGAPIFESGLAHVHRDDREEFVAALRRAAQTGGEYLLEHRIERDDGAIRVLRTHGRAVLDEHEVPNRLVGIVQDLTEEREMQARLLHAEKMESLGLLAGGIAHDFNNLLTVISGHAGLLRATLPDDDARNPDVEAILRASGRAAGLTSELLSFGRAQHLHPRVVDLRDSLARLEPLVGGVVGEEVQLRVVSGPTPLVRVDPHRFEQVLLNLVLNASDAMPEGGELVVETSAVVLDGVTPPTLAAGEYARIEVVDTGIGMEAETLAHIFDPFFTTKPVGRGTGLGVPTAAGIVEQSGGRLSFTSRPGVGTSATILLPAVDQPVDPPLEDQLHELRRAAGETILLVEDTQAVGAYSARVLRALGYAVIEAADAEIAGRVVERMHVDVVVTDVLMPGMNGTQLAARLRERHPLLRVLYVSGYAPDTCELMLEATENAFIAKPFMVEDLGRAVRELLDAGVAPDADAA